VWRVVTGVLSIRRISIRRIPIIGLGLGLGLGSGLGFGALKFGELKRNRCDRYTRKFDRITSVLRQLRWFPRLAANHVQAGNGDLQMP